MAIEAVITGNLLTNPVQKTVKTSRGEIKITEMRIMSDVWIQGRDGAESTPDESKTRPVQITVWNEALAELYAGAFRTGMRVEASGDLYLSEHKATEAERAEGKQDYADLRCDAHRVTLMLNRVEKITMRPKGGE